jgi:putative ABC transport system permease protein
MYKQFVKQAIGQLKEAPLVSLISIVGTALAIAVVLVLVLVFQINAAGFAPESNRARMLYVWGTEANPKDGSGNRNRSNMSAEVVKECFYTLREPEAVAAYVRASHPVSLPEKRLFKEYECCYTDAGYWKIFDFDFVEGAPFTEADFQSAIPRVVISNRMAASLFGGERAVGRQIVLDYVTYTVCGVTHDVPNPLMASFFDVCIPYSCNDNLMTPKPDYGENISGDLSMILLARSASGFEAVRAELDQQVRRYNENKVDYNVNFPAGALSQVDSAMGSNAWNKVDWQTFMAESGAFLLFLLLIPALNLTGVVQSSVQKRREEIGLRKAFGATGGNLLRQILSENLVLTLIGGLIGLPLSILLLVLGKSLVLNDPNITFTAAMLIKPGLFAAALLAAFLLNVLSAGIPAWRAACGTIVDSLSGNED